MNLKNIEKLASKILIRIALLVIIGTLPYILVITYKDYQKNDSVSVQSMVANTDFRSMAQKESEYTINMYNILRPVTRGGFSTYGYKNCMDDIEKISYTALNFKLALAFKYGEYEVPVEHILESNFNPYKVHEIYGELGLGGFWYSTAVFYYLYAEKYMPRNLWYLVHFDFSRPEHLLRYKNALKMSYIWKWIESRTYDNEEMWFASSRRWGRFIYRHYNNGNNIFPVKFVIKLSSGEVRKYNPRKIYYVWKTMCLNFEDGNIAASHELFLDFQRNTVKLEKEEIQYRTLKGRIRQLEKAIDNFENIELISKIELQNLKDETIKTKKIIKQIGGSAKKEGWKKHYKKLKDFCKGLIKSKEEK